MSERDSQFDVMPRTLDLVVSIPNVSAPCPVNTCPLTQPDGTAVCVPCLPAGLNDPTAVPALDTWAMLALGAALVAAALIRLKTPE